MLGIHSSYIGRSACRQVNTQLVTTYLINLIFISLILSAEWRRSFWVSSFAFIADIRMVSCFPVGSVTDNLCPSVRQLDAIFTSCNITVALGLMRVIIGSLNIIYGIGEVKWHSRNMVVMIVMVVMVMGVGYLQIIKFLVCLVCKGLSMMKLMLWKVEWLFNFG